MAAQGSAKSSGGINPTGLCQCGCGEPAPIAKRTKSKLVHVKGQPVRFQRGHQFRKFHVPVGERLAKQSERTSTGCLVWTGPTAGAGYGVISHKNRLAYVHRVSYELSNGPIPSGLEIDHLCEVKLCLEPSHLEAVTHAENMRRVRGRRVNV